MNYHRVGDNEMMTIDVSNYTHDIHIPNTVHSNTTYTLHLTNLTRDSLYNVSVAAYTSAGVGVASVPATVETGPYRKLNWWYKKIVVSFIEFSRL